MALLSAPACPSGPATLILTGEQLGLQIHESVGHALELDRVLGREASYAGTSYAEAGRAGVDADRVRADEHHRRRHDPGALGSFRWDDEGVEAQSVPLVREGVLSGFLSSRETASEIGLGAFGRLHARRGLRAPAARADDEREPRARGRGIARRPDR